MFLAISLSAESIHAHMPHHTCARHTGGKETQNAPHQRRPVTEIMYTAELTSTCDCSKLDRHHGGVEAADGCGVRTDRSDGHQTVQTVTLLVQPVTSIVCLCIYIIKSMSMNAMDSSSITFPHGRFSSLRRLDQYHKLRHWPLQWNLRTGDP